MPGDYPKALAKVWHKIKEEVGNKRANQLRKLVEDDTMEIIDDPSSGLPIERHRSIRLLELGIKDLNPAAQRKARMAYRALRLAKRGVIKREDGWKIVGPDGTESKPFPRK